MSGFHYDKIWKEGKYVDWWSVIHFLNGIFFSGIIFILKLHFSIGIIIFLALFVGWEVIEPGEVLSNKITDVIIGMAGFLLYLLFASLTSFIIIGGLAVIINTAAWLPKKNYKRLKKIF